jgi:hypothetical protein
MAKITRSEIVQHPEFQDDPGTMPTKVPSNTLKSLKTLPHRTVDETVALVLQAIWQAKRPVSRAEICKAVKRAKTPRMITIIEWLVDSGKLNKHERRHANGMPAYYYSLKVRFDREGNELPSWLEDHTES